MYLQEDAGFLFKAVHSGSRRARRRENASVTDLLLAGMLTCSCLALFPACQLLAHSCGGAAPFQLQAGVRQQRDLDTVLLPCGSGGTAVSGRGGPREAAKNKSKHTAFLLCVNDVSRILSLVPV